MFFSAFTMLYRATALVLLFLFSVVTLCAGQGLCCAQFERECADTHKAEHSEQKSEASCCSAKKDCCDDEAEQQAEAEHSGKGGSHHASHDNSCSACSMCSHCGASIVPGTVFLQSDLLPCGAPIYHSVLFFTVSAAYEIAEPPPNLA